VVLLSLGSLFLLSHRRRLLVIAVLVVAVASVLVIRQGWLRSFCTLETNYFCIKVEERERDGEPVRVLILDRLVHSFTSLDDPTMLVYVYEQIYAEATAYQAERMNHLRTLFIGGGGYTFPRYMEALYPEAELQVIEIDPGVTQVAQDKLGLSRDSSIVTYNEDARLFMEEDPDQRYDLILGDAFNDFSVPYHLTTREFNERVRAWLADEGLYIVNVIDGPGGDFIRAYVHTLRQTFRHVYLAPTISSWQQASRSTFVIIGTATPLDLEAFEPGAYLTRLLMSEGEVDAFLGEGRLVTLTDQYAPVDQMLAPVFRGQAGKEGE
jgi:spermidine synthase